MQSNIEEAINGVVESGNNDYGKYIKYEDGTMICWGGNTGVDGSYRLVTFPMPFVESPKVNANTIVYDDNFIHFTQVYDINVTGFKTVVRFSSAVETFWQKGSNYFDWMAIGKWK